jgi:hypothetical protein
MPPPCNRTPINEVPPLNGFRSNKNVASYPSPNASPQRAPTYPTQSPHEFHTGMIPHTGLHASSGAGLAAEFEDFIARNGDLVNEAEQTEPSPKKRG